MIRFAGAYYDGVTSERHRVTVSVEGDQIHVRGGNGIDLSFPAAEAVVAPQLGEIRGMIRLPGDGMIESADHRGVEALLRLQRRGGFFLHVHRWERSLKRIAVALLITAVVVAGMVSYGIPALAKRLAFALPPGLESSLGSETLDALDKLAFTPSRLPEPRRKELLRLFREMTRRLPYAGGYRLELRWSDKIGANAFALPSGVIVVTDQLIDLARNDSEIAGVLAHEMAHERNRHALRQLLQNSSVALVIATLTGDLTSVTTLGATLPTALINAKFSRSFETEADDGAVDYLHQAGIPPRSYAEFLARMETERSQAGRRAGVAAAPPGVEYLSSHPDTKKRILRILAREKLP